MQLSKFHPGKSLLLKVFYILLFYVFITPFSLAIDNQGVSANYLFVFFPIIVFLLKKQISLPPKKVVWLMIMLSLIFLYGLIFQVDSQDLFLRRSASFLVFMSVFALMFAKLDLDMLHSFKFAIILWALIDSSGRIIQFILIDGNNIGFYAKGIIGTQRIGFVYLMAFWLVAILKIQNNSFKIIKFIALYVLLAGIFITYSRSSFVGYSATSVAYFLYIIVSLLKYSSSIKAAIKKIFIKVFYKIILLMFVVVSFNGPMYFYGQTIFKFIVSTQAKLNLDLELAKYTSEINATTDLELLLSEINATTDLELLLSEKNATTDLELKLSEKNATTDLTDKNSTTDLELLLSEKNATTDLELKLSEKNATTDLTDKNSTNVSDASAKVFTEYIKVDLASSNISNTPESSALVNFYISKIKDNLEIVEQYKLIKKTITSISKLDVIGNNAQKNTAQMLQALYRAKKINDPEIIESALSAYNISIAREIFLGEFNDKIERNLNNYNSELNLITYKLLLAELKKNIKINDNNHSDKALVAIIESVGIAINTINTINAMDEKAIFVRYRDKSSSLGYRVYMHKLVFSETVRNPLTGSSFLGVWSLFENKEGSAHNQYLDILFRIGALAFIAYLFFMYKITLFLYQKELGLFFGFIGVLTIGLFHETIKLSQGGFIYAFLFAIWTQRKSIWEDNEKTY